MALTKPDKKKQRKTVKNKKEINWEKGSFG
jgi:hypothetical protein